MCESHHDQVSPNSSAFAIETEVQYSPLHLFAQFSKNILNISEDNETSSRPLYQRGARNGVSVIAIESIPNTSRIYKAIPVSFFSAYGIIDCRL